MPNGTECIKCPAGRYGNAPEETRDTCVGACAVGHYCPLGSATSAASKCPAGRFGSTQGLKDEACSGNCTAGYYCEIGEHVATPGTKLCAAGRYGTTGQTTVQVWCGVVWCGVWYLSSSSLRDSLCTHEKVTPSLCGLTWFSCSPTPLCPPLLHSGSAPENAQLATTAVLAPKTELRMCAVALTYTAPLGVLRR